MGYTTFFKAIRGFDEYYEEWGGEDDDLMRRFEYLGLTTQTPPDQSFYLHQWHADSRGRGSSAEQSTTESGAPPDDPLDPPERPELGNPRRKRERGGR